MIDRNVLVSVIVPVYNVEQYLEKCVDSVLAQTMADFELILVDDGSTDSSGKLCDQILTKDNRIKVIHKQNGGLSSARNAGLDIACGKYIYFLDSDDYVDPVLLEKTIFVMEEKQSDWVGFGMKKEDPEGNLLENICFVAREIEVKNEEDRMEFLLEYLLNYRLGWEAWSRIYKREIIEKYNLRFVSEREIFAEDMLFSFFYWLYAEKCVILPDAFYHYIQRADSLMGQKKFKNILPNMHSLATEAYRQVKKAGLKLIESDFGAIYMHLLEWQTRDYIAEKGLEWTKEELNKLAYTDFLPDCSPQFKHSCIEYMQKYGAIDGLVSVVLLVKSQNDVEKTADYINSILMQTLQKIEVVVVHPQTVEFYHNDIRIKTIAVENCSCDYMYRTAIDNANGEYIYFADNAFKPKQNFLQKMADIIKYNNSGSAIIAEYGNVFVDMYNCTARFKLKKYIKNTGIEYHKCLFKKDVLVSSGVYHLDNIHKYFAEIILSDHIVVIKGD